MGYKIPVLTFFTPDGASYPATGVAFKNGVILSTLVPGDLYIDDAAEVKNKTVKLGVAEAAYTPQSNELLLIQFKNGNTAPKVSLKLGNKEYILRKSIRPTPGDIPVSFDPTLVGIIEPMQLCLIQIRNEFAYWLDWDNTELFSMLLDEKASTDSVNTALNEKANKTDVTKALESKANKTDIPTKASQLAQDVKYVKAQAYYNVEVAPSNFVEDTTYIEFPYKASVILNEQILESMLPIVTLSVKDALDGNIAPVAACITGGIYLYAAEKPVENVKIETVLIVEV